MEKLCDKCKKFPAEVSYTETVNGKTRHLNLCDVCAGSIMEEKSKFLDSFFNLDPFKEIDQMFKEFMPTRPKASAMSPSPQPAPLLDLTEEKLKELKKKLDELKQEEAIAVMVQDYMKAAEIKKKREKLQKEAEKIINQ